MKIINFTCEKKLNGSNTKSNRNHLQSDTWERRAKMVEMDLTRVGTQRMLDTIAEQYHMPRESVANDWYVRDKWMPTLCQLGKSPESTSKMLVEVFSGFKVVRSLLMDTYMTADNANAKVGALNAYAAALDQEAQLRLSLGLLEKKPTDMVTKSITPSDLMDEFIKRAPKELMNDFKDLAPK